MSNRSPNNGRPMRCPFWYSYLNSGIYFTKLQRCTPALCTIKKDTGPKLTNSIPMSTAIITTLLSQIPNCIKILLKLSTKSQYQQLRLPVSQHINCPATWCLSIRGFISIKTLWKNWVISIFNLVSRRNKWFQGTIMGLWFLRKTTLSLSLIP